MKLHILWGDGRGAMKAVILANGEAGDLGFLRENVSRGDVLICCDGGARWAEALGLRPDHIVGDMDSVPPELLGKYRESGVNRAVWPADKDFTDLELAVSFARGLGADAVDILAALGGRPDHAMANICVLSQAPGAARILEPGLEIRAVAAGMELEIKGKAGDVVSLLPLEEARGVATEGLKYPLRGETLFPGFARGVSNEMAAGAARVAVGEGVLIVFHLSHNMSSPE